MSYSNPLFDYDFLYDLSVAQEREIYARITSLTWEETPLEYIEGKVTGGSINVDGKSAVRRTCSLSLVAKDVNISDFYWGLKTKFKLEIGLRNKINKKYPDIIWFKQGLYIITAFTTQKNINNYTINISGKDKMCLLNGDIAGSLPHTTDFGVEEYYDSTTGITTYSDIPIKTIIRESVQNFGNELAKNIIINDIEDAGLELLEYRGDTPIYMLREYNSDVFTNITINKNQPCYLIDDLNTRITISDSRIVYDDLVNLDEDSSISSIIQLSNDIDAHRYKVAKFEYGSIPGYRLTNLTYAGELIGEVGSTITQMLDKLITMLGYFEYYYDLDGRFIFQRKQEYVQTSLDGSQERQEKIIANAAINTELTFNFIGNNLISAISNNPNILNIKNDFAVWGVRKTLAGAELDIHMRYAIDKKPFYYKAYDGTVYTTSHLNNSQYVDWREIIFQMAKDYRRHYHDDDFLYQIEQNNIFNNINLYPGGKTGYEQYYVDLEGFWRLLYDTNPELNIRGITLGEINDDIEKLYIKYPYKKATEEDLKNVDLNDLYIIYKGQLCPFVKGYCHLDKNGIYFFKTSEGKMNQGTSSQEILNTVNIKDIYIKNAEDFLINNQPFNVLINHEGTTREPVSVFQQSTSISGMNNDYLLFIEACFKEVDKNLLYIRNTEYIPFEDLTADIKNYYYKDGQYQDKIYTYKSIDNYGNITDETLISEDVIYCEGYYNYNRDSTTGNYWAKEVSQNPEQLLFWFDFLDGEGSDIAKYSVPAIGSRTKAVKDTNVKSIYYREIPTTIFQNGIEIYEHQPGYTYVQLQNTMENLFTISSKGISAKERIEEFLNDYIYCAANVNITALPVYFLKPNSRIRIHDEDSQISGEYLVDKFTIPLTHNGTMSITATKVVEDII